MKITDRTGNCGKTTSRTANLNGWRFHMHLPALKDLHVSRKFLLRIAPVAFQELAGKRVTEVLHAL